MSNKITSFHEAAVAIQEYIDERIRGWIRRVDTEYKQIATLQERYKLAGDARVGLNMEENLPRLVRKEISLIALQQASRYTISRKGSVISEENAKSWLSDVVDSLKRHLDDVIDANSGRTASVVEAPLFFEKITALHEQIDDLRHQISIKAGHLSLEVSES